MSSLPTDVTHSPQSNHVPNGNKITTNIFIKSEWHSVTMKYGIPPKFTPICCTEQINHPQDLMEQESL